MTTKRILIFAPLLLTLVLVQSYFWVPTYEQQAKSNPDRLNQYINASIGDAAILNPILSADSASSDIEGKVFEGLIDRDEELRFRGRLATSWKLYEEAFFFVNESADIPGLGRANPQMVVDLLQKAKRDRVGSSAELNKTLDNIKSISLISANTYHITEPAKTSNDGKKAGEIKITVSAPARIKLHLHEVDQDPGEVCK